MLEVLMTKNENNSHAFMKKMAENIKLTKDAQSPDESKTNEVRYILGQWVLRYYRKKYYDPCPTCFSYYIIKYRTFIKNTYLVFTLFH